MDKEGEDDYYEDSSEDMDEDTDYEDRCEDNIMAKEVDNNHSMQTVVKINNFCGNGQDRN